MRGTRNSAAGWMTPPTTPAFLTPGTPPTVVVVPVEAHSAAHRDSEIQDTCARYEDKREERDRGAHPKSLDREMGNANQIGTR